MPEKDIAVKDAITSVVGTSRLGRRKTLCIECIGISKRMV